MRQGTPRARHIRHRSLDRMRRQELLPEFIEARSDALEGDGTTAFLSDIVYPSYAEAIDVDFDVILGPANVTGVTMNQGTINHTGLDFVESVAGFSETLAASAAANNITMTGASLANASGPFLISSTASLPGGLAADTFYWLGAVDADVYTLHTNRADAVAGTNTIDISSAGTGTISADPGFVIELTAHGYTDLVGPVQYDAGGTLAAGMALDVPYWVYPNGVNQLVVLADPADLVTHDYVAVTAAGEETHNIVSSPIFYKAGHGFAEDDGPFLIVGSELPAGIDAGDVVFAQPFTSDWFGLTRTRAEFVANFPNSASDTVAVTLELEGASVLNSATHGVSGEFPVTVSSTDELPSGLTEGVIYWAKDIDDDGLQLFPTASDANNDTNPVILGSEGTGTLTLAGVAGISFDSADPNLPAGFGPVQLTTDGTLPGGLAVDTDYFVTPISDNLYGIADNLEDALAGTFIEVDSSSEDGSHTLTSESKEGGDLRTFTATAATDVLASTAHGFSDLEGPVVVASSSTLPGGLVADQFYWVARIDADSFKLAPTRQMANLDQAVDITSTGSGTHTIARATTEEAVLEALKYNPLEKVANAVDIDDLA